MDFTVGMALVDFLPVIAFIVASVIFQRDLYNKMSKGAFALYSAGTIFVAVAGACKALWKLLYAAGVCDFYRLNEMFFPMQSMGFLLAAIGIIGLFFFDQNEKRLASVVPVAFSGTMIFVGFTIVGVAVMNVGYCVMAKKLKKPLALALFIFALVGSLAMGYLSTKNFELAAMNWLAEIINTLAQGALMAGAIILDKAGLKDLEIKKAK